MLIAKGFSNWKRAKHGPRTQAKAIEYISSKIELAETYSQGAGVKSDLHHFQKLQ